MATFPTDVCFGFEGYSETFDPSVDRTEMERGVPKQRVINSQVLVKINAGLIFKSAAAVVSFDTWYFDTIKRIGWFTMPHPRTGATITARFENGALGALTSMAPAFGVARREVVLEYLR
jgi:hypothetical protein